MLGKRIKFLRKKIGKTQKDLEKATNIPQTTISRWENEQGEPVASDIKKLAFALKVTINDLLDDNPLSECNKPGAA